MFLFSRNPYKCFYSVGIHILYLGYNSEVPIYTFCVLNFKKFVLKMKSYSQKHLFGTDESKYKFFHSRMICTLTNVQYYF